MSNLSSVQIVFNKNQTAEKIVSRYDKLPAAVRRCPDFSGNDIKIMLVLVDYMLRHRCCYPSLETIAKKARLSRCTISRRTKRLQDLGYLIIEKFPYQSNVYALSQKLLEFHPRSKSANVIPIGSRGATSGSNLRPYLVPSKNKEIHYDPADAGCRNFSNSSGRLETPVGEKTPCLNSTPVLVTKNVGNARTEKHGIGKPLDPASPGPRECDGVAIAKPDLVKSGEIAEPLPRLREPPSPQTFARAPFKIIQRPLRLVTVEQRRAAEGIHRVFSDSMASRGFKPQDMMDWEIPQIGNAVREQGLFNIQKLMRYAVMNWELLATTTGKDGLKLDARPSFNQILAKWRTRWWVARMNGTGKWTAKKKKKAKETERKNIESAKSRGWSFCPKPQKPYASSAINPAAVT